MYPSLVLDYDIGTACPAINPRIYFSAVVIKRLYIRQIVKTRIYQPVNGSRNVVVDDLGQHR
jgi:hypothetical protein